MMWWCVTEFLYYSEIVRKKNAKNIFSVRDIFNPIILNKYYGINHFKPVCIIKKLTDGKRKKIEIGALGDIHKLCIKLFYR